MTKYNDFAKRLDEAFKAARSEYNAAMDEVEACQQAISRARSMTSEQYIGEKQAKLRRAELGLLEAKENMEKVHRSAWEGFDRTVETLKKELAEAVRRDNMANPDAVDPNAVKLIESGMLTPDDCEGMLEKFADNATMTRMISAYADGKVKALEYRDPARSRFAAVTIAAQQAPIVSGFDQLCEAANICSQGHRGRKIGDAAHIRTMCGKWEELAGAGIENF